MDVIETLSLRGRTAYIDLIEPLEEGVAEVLIADEDGVLLHVQDTAYVATLFNPEAADTFAEAVPTSKGPISVHAGPLVSAFKERGLTDPLECMQAVYPSTQLLVEDESIIIRPLMDRDLPVVLQHYKLVDEAYILERFQAGVMIAAEIDGNLAGFMGRHIECSMGMLEVLPQYRRRHVGEALERTYINHLLSQDITPYCHVVAGNTASLSLQRKLGLEVSAELVYWFN
ncbi:MAG: GNAT family N-acetyltransferase [Spirochaetaceae bacterium]|jgi:tRNA (guanine37-N1)-methyltransferase|nr:GNAT family N-acetyltransferase [Spirochaetaceae bacterium]